MSFSVTTNRVQYTGDGVTLVFAYTFKVFLATDLKVYVDDAAGVAVLKTNAVDYTVSSVGESAGGNVTFTVAPASARKVTIKRELPLTQLTQWPENDKFPASGHEAAADRLVMIVLQLQETVGRALSLPVNSALSNLTFPEGTSAANRALKSFRWDSAGTALELVTLVASGTYIDPVNATGQMIRGGDTGLQEAFNIGAVGSMLWVIAGKPGWFAPGSNTNYLSVAAGIPSWRTVAQVLSDIGGAAASHTHAAADIASGTVATARLGSGSASATTFLRGDQSWADAGYRLRGYLFGLTMSNNAGDATNDIDIATGECSSSDAANADRVTLAPAAMTKQLDAVWAAGSAAGGRVGALANGTWHVYAFRRSGGTDDFFMEQSLTPTVPDGGTKYRRIGSILRESAAIVGFVQDGDLFMRKASILDVDATNPGTAAVTRTLSVPTGINVVAIINALYQKATGTSGGFVLSDLAVNDEAPSTTAAPLSNVFTFAEGASTDTGTVGPVQVRTNTSAQIRSRTDSSDASTIARIATLGWIDARGRIA